MNRPHKRKKIDLLFVTATISTTLVLLLIGIITFLLLSARQLSSNLREEMTLELVLDDGISRNDVTEIIGRLDKMPYTKECTYISKEDALGEMTGEMGVNPSEFLQYNPFYASISLKLTAGYANYDSIRTITPEIESVKAVKEINYQKDLMNTVNDNIRKISAMLLGMALLLSLISITLINNTIKLTIYSLRFILYSMKLVGAKWSFIRRPFIRKNIRIGVASAILACACFWGILKFCIRYEPELASLMTVRVMIPVYAVITTTGLLITWICALSSVNRFLRMKSGELYYI
ncbi:MAG: permease-like cell division protein FtsX [Bacteroidaceae bacterium]|nr:permease-like cell division protein FtsX [Bacteroidaceae bacterium]